MNLLDGKTALIFGVANDHSIAWGIAKALPRARGAAGVLVRRRSARAPRPPAGRVRRRELRRAVRRRQGRRHRGGVRQGRPALGKIDILVHAVAYAGREELSRPYSETSRAGFQTAMDISVYSFTALARAALPLMPDGGSMLTLTYYGSQKVMPNYNVMGVAKAALESSVRYLAAELGPPGHLGSTPSRPARCGPYRPRGSAGFKDLYRAFTEIAPLRRPITIEDVGGTAVWLASDLSRTVTGEVVYVDSGYNILGLTAPTSAE